MYTLTFIYTIKFTINKADDVDRKINIIKKY